MVGKRNDQYCQENKRRRTGAIRLRQELINKYVKAQQFLGGKRVWDLKEKMYEKPIAEMTDDEIEELLRCLRKIPRRQRRV